MTKELELFLIRHAQTQGNLEHRYIGRTDEPLSQAALAGFCNLAYPAADRVICSPMLRCVQTARILYPMQDPVIEPDLRECDFGLFEGKTYAELEKDFAYTDWISGKRMVPPGGESRQKFQDRCCLVFSEILNQAFGQNLFRLAFVVHGGTIMSILERFAVPHRPFYDWQSGSLGCWKVSVSEAEWTSHRSFANPEKLF